MGKDVNFSFFVVEMFLHLKNTGQFVLVLSHLLIKEQGGIFKKFLNQADPNNQAGWDFFQIS